MIKKSLLVFFNLAVFVSFVIAGPGIDRFNRMESARMPDENSVYVNTNSTVVNIPIILEGEKMEGDYWFGPEVSTTLSGFYDYQTNGECKHQINRGNATTLHSIMMYSSDSLNVSPSRRTGYAFSADDGATWTFVTDIPTIRSGFGSLSAYVAGASTGAAFLSNHYQPGAFLTGAVHYDVAPGAGSFTTKDWPATGQIIVWPCVSPYTNNNFMVCGESYSGGAGTDTGLAMVYNTTSNTYTNMKTFISAATSQTNMRWTYATGPGGNGIYVLDAISDAGGAFGLNRIFIYKTTDNGVTWDAGSVMFDATISGSDTLSAFFGLDAIYDNAGNYYVAFNTTSPGGTFASGKLWVSKNSAPPVIVAQHTGTNGIPEAANLVLHADAGICTIDHPSLGVSLDGSTIFCAFSVQYEADTLNGFNKCHIYYSFSSTATLNFNAPIKVTNSGPGSADERYVSIIKTIPNLGGTFGNTCFLVYQKDSQPGSSAFNDAAPVTRARLISRKIYQADSPIGIHEIGGNIPKEYSLHQNFPNPFNPVTKIRFDIPIESSVSIKVYDAVGRLVAILVNNETLKAGTKELSFNASSLASGVYYYTINAGEFNSTKKMVLVK